MDSDDEAALEVHKKKEQREWQKFYSKLADFPNSFQLENEHHEMELTHLGKLRKGLESALSVGYKTPLETARAKNYLAFLLHCEGRPSDALALTEEALSEEGEGHNLVSLANRAVILWHTGRREEAELEVDKLQAFRRTREFDCLKVKARAELAFCYTRMGPRFFLKAVAVFEEVLSKAGRLERWLREQNRNDFEKWLWTFGLGLAKRRSLHLMHATAYQERDITAESFDALNAFRQVIRCSRNTNLKAKAHAEIAKLISCMCGDAQLKQNLIEEARMGPVKACMRAVELDQNDNSVLCKAGHILRKRKFYKDSRELLEKARAIRPSSTVFHHLALTYIKLAEMAKTRDETGETATQERTLVWNGRGRGNRERGDAGRGNRGRGQGRGFSSAGAREREMAEWQMQGRQDQRQMRGRAGEWRTQRRGAEQQLLGRGGQWQERGTAGQWQGAAPGEGSRGRSRYQNTRERRGYWELRQREGVGLGAYGSVFGSGNPSQLPDRASPLDDISGSPAFPSSRGTSPFLHDTEHTTRSEAHCKGRAQTDFLEERLRQMTLDQQINPEEPQQTPPVCVNRDDGDQGFSTTGGHNTTAATDHQVNEVHCMKFARSDYLVSEAFECFEKAVEFSEGTNIQAKFDLALLHRDVDELDKALDLLAEIRFSNREHLNYLTVSSFQEAGLILKEKSNAEENEQIKKQLRSQADTMFYTALTKAAQLMSRSPQLHGHLKKAWDTLPQLLEEVERSDLNETQRLGRKAELFKVIKNPEASMALLNEIRQMQPDEGQNPKHLKLTIENLVEMKEFEQAVAMIELVKCTSQDTEVFGLFDDEQYVLKVYAQAAKQALLTDSPTEHFRAAFIYTMMQTQFEGSSTSDTDSSDGDPETWDIMMIYNRKKDSCAQTAKAKAVARILTDACGLKVTVMDDAVRLGRLADDGMVHVMRRSHMVLVLAGSQKICSEMRMLVSHATRRPESNTVTLLTDGEHVPLKLKTYRSMPCPPELLLPVTERVECNREQTGRYSEQTIRAICKLFGFLVGIHKGNG